MRKWFRFFLIIAFAISTDGSFAQVKVFGQFLEDSVKLGMPARFTLSARYSSDLTVLFPDSAAQFAPFEFSSKKYYKTETQEGISVDSVIYTVTTFEIDATQGLQLPVYLVTESDCTTYLSNTDSIQLIEVVRSMPDSLTLDNLPLKESTAYVEVDYEVNYVIVGAVAGALLLIAVVIWIFFGKRIQRYYRMRRMKRLHTQFVTSYNHILNQITTSFSSQVTENALASWKRYMEQLEAKPYTKLTTAETVKLYHDDALGQRLRAVDRAIYGHSTTVLPALEELKVIADDRFHSKLKEVMHGK